MAVFRPTAVRDKLTDIDIDLLKKMDVEAILLDVDNTLASYRSHEPIDGSLEWVDKMTKSGFKLIIVSNNFEKRVRPIAEKFALDCISFAVKPFPFGYLRAGERLRVKHKNSVIIGDQIFTDVIGANMCGMKSILIKPIEIEIGLSFDIRRGLEKGLRKKYDSERKVF